MSKERACGKCTIEEVQRGYEVQTDLTGSRQWAATYEMAIEGLMSAPPEIEVKVQQRASERFQSKASLFVDDDVISEHFEILTAVPEEALPKATT